MQKVRAEISLRNIRHNAESFLSWTKKPLCAVVKANAYGHGAEEVANALSPYVSAFAVSLIEEAIAIRTAACGKEILVFTPPTNEEECYHLAVNGFIASITDEGVARLIMGFCKKYALPMRAHIKVNTGMNRYGLELGSLKRVCATLRREKLVFIEGVYSHLYKNNRAVCYAQREKFSSAVSVCKLFYPNVIAHLGATYGAMLGKDFFFDGLRIGLGLYGYLPTCEEKVKTALSLKKGMQVYAKGVSTRIYQFGGVGYGEGCAREGERLSLLRFGYADGYLRDRKNGVENWQKNKNELCMDVTIREGNVKKGAWTPILTDADAVAKTTGTIAYEVLCAATRRAEFIYRN